MNPVQVFAFTWSMAQLEPDDYHEHIEAMKLSFNNSKDYCFQVECTWPENDSPNVHMQGYFRTNKAVRPITLQNKYQAVGFQGIHIQPASMNGIDALRNYCMKTESRMLGPWTKRPVMPWEMKQEEDSNMITENDFIQEKDLWDWQRQLIQEVSRPVGIDKRTIYWVWSRATVGMGKSSIAEYMRWHLGADMITFKSANDMMSQVYAAQRKRIFLIMLPHTLAFNSSFSIKDLYASIEQVKDGYYDNQKCKAGQKAIWVKRPHVVVFANFPPDTDKLTHDRLRVKELVEGRDNKKGSESDALRAELESLDTEMSEGTPEGDALRALIL